ncbi:CIC11C00000003032 [Sungouiella intermedia]|uniref:CIC11C00000003032 n=1 Tax=Sungouiella intermedia TaxID=45354 RepID=A0A1L0D7W4_9ASCO|nr:CIC11C00000003032 [[Candida] intermedia]
MAKKSTKPAAKPKAAAKTEETLSVDHVSDSSSSEELSSDEEIEMEEPQADTPAQKGQKGHSVNLQKQGASETTKIKKLGGVIYVGRLPKQLEERELKKYFGQFGDITNVRVSRNKKTGSSRHYAFVKFKQHDVAAIAAETMNNYLIFGHLLKVHVIENPKDNLFSAKMTPGFKEFDWRGKEYAEAMKAKPLETWKKLQLEYEQQKVEKFEELKSLGFDYVLEA